MAEQTKNETAEKVKAERKTVNATLNEADYAEVAEARHEGRYDKLTDFVREAVLFYARKLNAERQK